MACEGNGMSDERIGTALITEVIEEKLKDMPAEDVPHLASAKVKTEHEKKMVTQLGVMVRIIGDRMQDDQEFQDAVDGLAQCSGSKWDKFNAVAEKVIEHGITWEKIAVLFYVAGKLAVKMVEAHLPQSVTEILKWTIDFFKNKLLDWIREHGGWINSFSELAGASMQSVSSLSSQRVVIIFIAGLSLGSFITFITLRLTR